MPSRGGKACASSREPKNALTPGEKQPKRQKPHCWNHRLGLRAAGPPWGSPCIGSPRTGEWAAAEKAGDATAGGYDAQKQGRERGRGRRGWCRPRGDLVCGLQWDCAWSPRPRPGSHSRAWSQDRRTGFPPLSAAASQSRREIGGKAGGGELGKE
ncbi:hypothetical protein VUR80DRAFT_6590 [Thermomyces stellatus]